ncbi:MAG: beta-N-acetylhexosaminidase [Pseudonocardiales bacterium]|nr:beta-N-acetylhexosaminidase [Pseudonocardiales bacterium]
MGRRWWVATAAVLLAATACSARSPTMTTAAPSRPSAPTSISAPQSDATPSSASSSPSAPPKSTPARPLSRARQILAGMSLAERVGQLLMVDCPSTEVGLDTVVAIGRYHVGSVILDHTSFLTPQQTSTIVTLLTQRASPNVGLFVATDQEGGQVQRLLGPGFTTIPTAVQQGTLTPATLRRQAQQWGSELHAAGVNVNLAPVLDTVPSGFGPNPPVGDLNREYGRDPASVSSHGNAFAQGMQAAGVAATVKLFPGLGRVSGNTDLTPGVLDTVTTRHDPYLAPFADAIRQGVGFVMISTAIYTKIDRDQPAAFSPTIVTGMLRGDLRFRGVIISDDVGISKQLSGTTVADRAVKFIAAGGDIVLTVDATQAPAMTAALIARATRDPKFKRQVDAAALVVLQAKQAHGLLH